MRMRSFDSIDPEPISAKGVLCATVLAVCLMTAGAASAHVALDLPNGGEVLEAGAAYSIAWHDRVQHGPADYDLWYSLTGPSGPWIEIASDLEPSPDDDGHSFAWIVPRTDSQMVRVRVRQDNSSADYTDVSDADLTIVESAAAATVSLEPSSDATMYEGDGSVANGSGSYLFVGRNGSGGGATERRALIAFDVAASIPAGATITSVTLEMYMSRTASAEHQVAIYRVLESWNEGPSDAPGQEGSGTPSLAGDVTWAHRSFPNSLWSTGGGSFEQSASASLLINDLGSYSFSSTAQMVADVQDWLDEPSSNYGWALVMPGAPTHSAKRFDSRENATGASRPRLVIEFDEAGAGPVAQFDFSPQNPEVGDMVQFTDLSTGSPSTWSWSFGDGATSQQQHPIHSFDTAGDFAVTLDVSNANGSDSITTTLSVSPGTGPDLSELVFIPAAANAAGSGDSFFITTADVHNPGSQAASFAFLWLPRDSNNASPTRSGVFTLEPGATMRFHNLLGEVFEATAAVGAAAVVSDSSELEVMSRTFNQTAGGTFGQSLPGVPTDELIPAGDRVRVLFLTEDDNFRSNLGLLNGTDMPTVVQWELFDSSGERLRSGQRQLPAWGNVQVNRILADFAPLEAATAIIWTDTTGGAFTCYGSVLDEQTSDPTTVLPR